MENHITLMAVALLAAGSAAAQEEAVTDGDRFALWNECKPVGLVVERLDEDAAAMGLSREDITIAARSRLRSARIYTEERPAPRLYISVNVGSSAYSVHVGLNKRVLDLTSGKWGYAETWYTGGYGTHGGDPAFILSHLSRYIDRFIDEYLRVNAEACS